MPYDHVNMNAQSNGDHFHAFCGSAVAEAKRHYPQPSGCYHCCSACHTA
jgi:hypothetical protein